MFRCTYFPFAPSRLTLVGFTQLLSLFQTHWFAFVGRSLAYMSNSVLFFGFFRMFPAYHPHPLLFSEFSSCAYSWFAFFGSTHFSFCFIGHRSAFVGRNIPLSISIPLHGFTQLFSTFRGGIPLRRRNLGNSTYIVVRFHIKIILFAFKQIFFVLDKLYGLKVKCIASIYCICVLQMRILVDAIAKFSQVVSSSSLQVRSATNVEEIRIVKKNLVYTGYFGWYTVHTSRNQTFLGVTPGMFIRPMVATSVQHCQAKPYLITSSNYTINQPLEQLQGVF